MDGVDPLKSRTGGAYIPPGKLRALQSEIKDKNSVAYQRLAWEALKKSINGLVNKVNTTNLRILVRELFGENIIRGRGLLTQSLIRAQAASPSFTRVYASLSAVINAKFPNIGLLLLKRLILSFRKAFRRNDKAKCISSTHFIAHLINQNLAHEILSLEIATLLLQTPNDDSIEIAISFIRQIGAKLSLLSPKGLRAIFERLRSVLHETPSLEKRTQYMIEVIFQVRKDGFKDDPIVTSELDLIQEDDQFTHMISLDDGDGPEDILNVFKEDPSFLENEEKYKAIKKELLDSDSDDDSSSGSDDNSEDDDDEEEEEAKNKESSDRIIDETQTNLIALRRTIYLTIQSSLDFEETVHKLMKMELKSGHEQELCHMVIDCCAQQRTYEKFYGLLAQRLCQLKKEYVEPFEKIFVDSYNTVHRLEIGKLRFNLYPFKRIRNNLVVNDIYQAIISRTGGIHWSQKIECAYTFAINFFTSIGLGGLTEDLRLHLKSKPTLKMIEENGEKKVETLQGKKKTLSGEKKKSKKSKRMIQDGKFKNDT
ncbi:CWC22 [Lepeophtheirus salmonis]|uniref:CWC22 n=1 Tax=Lepeophtheirus salmonis TaxID=72036 RepID=A0A7R8CFH4_LEPSM|nr:CWC22 [Lepeophtheirus salmonis]CAF2751464.1 CWC22 [Lepeophtheirus salmonis]